MIESSKGDAANEGKNISYKSRGVDSQMVIPNFL